VKRVPPATIVGVGASAFARSLPEDGDALAVDACRAALADAGLAPGQVDGVVTYLGSYEHAPLEKVLPTLGIDRDGLRLCEDVFALAPAAMTALDRAVRAVESGHCETVLVYKCNKWKRGQPPGVQDQPIAQGEYQWTMPYGLTMTAQTLAMWAMRHFALYGTTSEHLGALCVQTRRHAALNPRATLREPLTLEQYLASPWISEPFRRLDCDYPIDGAGAAVVTTPERARDLRATPVHVLASATRDAVWEEWEMWPDFTAMASKPVSDAVWAECGLAPGDVDTVQLYDGFSWLALCWLEDAGFCAKGEGGPFIASGATALGGALPLNTHGGNLSEGRSHGVGHLIEAVCQLRGSCGERQVPEARVAFAANGGGPIAGAVVLSTETT
jgi:acetyl-CoA acetyltransferase